MTRVLVTFGSRRGGTAEIATVIADALRARGLEVDCARAAEVRDLAGYHAVVVGGALYVGRWIREARRFVTANAAALRARPVWLFSSGPLDATANAGALGPTPQVAALVRRIGARGHATFGGRLAADASGFVASAMAKKLAGDWRDWPQIRAWADEVARAIEAAPAGPPPLVPPPVHRPHTALYLVIAALVIAGGTALAFVPDGSLLAAPPEWLAYMPFASFRIPGALLLATGVVLILEALGRRQRSP